MYMYTGHAGVLNVVSFQDLGLDKCCTIIVIEEIAAIVMNLEHFKFIAISCTMALVYAKNECNGLVMSLGRHPMVISTVLKARNTNDVIFVSDSVLEPKPGAIVNYLDRKSESAIHKHTSKHCLFLHSPGSRGRQVSFPGGSECAGRQLLQLARHISLPSACAQGPCWPGSVHAGNQPS